MLRERKLIIGTGQKGVGKSYTTFWEYIVDAVSVRKQKVLIIDVNDEYGKMEPNDENANAVTNGKKFVVRAIDPTMVKTFSKQYHAEVRRIRPINFKTGKLYKYDELLDIVQGVIEDFRGGLLLMEDIVAMMGNNMSKDIMSLIARNRHFDLDIILHLQSVGMILPRLYQSANYVRYHKQLDSILKSKNKLNDLLELFMLAEYLVDHYYFDGDVRYYCWIDIDNKKIIGNFTSDTFIKCIDKYLSQNPKEFKLLLNEIDESGRKKYTHATALKSKKEMLFKMYYGN